MMNDSLFQYSNPGVYFLLSKNISTGKYGIIHLHITFCPSADFYSIVFLFVIHKLILLT